MEDRPERPIDALQNYWEGLPMEAYRSVDKDGNGVGASNIIRNDDTVLLHVSSIEGEGCQVTVRLRAREVTGPAGSFHYSLDDQRDLLVQRICTLLSKGW